MQSSEYDFFKNIEALSKISNIKKLNKKIDELTDYVFSKHNAFYAYRLASELDKRNISFSDLEDYIIKICVYSYYNSRYLLIMALNLKNVNFEKLEKAIIKNNDPVLMAEFDCFVPYETTTNLEQIVIDKKMPKASLIYLKYKKCSDINEHKKILIKSKKSRYLYNCAKISNNKEEFELIENLIIKNKSNYYVRLMATLPNANIIRLEDRIISTNDIQEIIKMFKITNSKRLAKYAILL